MKIIRTWLVAFVLAATGLMGALGGASAQDDVSEAGEQVGGATIEIVTYVCEDAERAGDVDFYFAAVNEADTATCRLGEWGEYTFSLNSTTDGEVDQQSTDEIGLATFSNVAPGEYFGTETTLGVSSAPGTVEDGDYVSVTFIHYVAEVIQPEPTTGGVGYLQIEHKYCLNDERAGETDFFPGAETVVLAESVPCEFGVGSEFTVTPIDIELPELDSVEGAGVPAWTTGEDGLTDTNEVIAGSYQVTEDANGATSDTFDVPVETYVLVTVIDYVGSGEEPEGATLTIHKAECLTGVGADIFEECHDNALEDVAFDANGTVIATDEDGVAALDIAAGETVITEDPDVFADYAGAYVYCSEQNTGLVLFDGDAETGDVTIEAFDGDDIVCDWYNLSDEVADDDDDATDDDEDEDEDTDDVTTLPSTGTGAMAASTGSSALLIAGLFSVIGVAGVSALRRQRA